MMSFRFLFISDDGNGRRSARLPECFKIWIGPDKLAQTDLIVTCQVQSMDYNKRHFSTCNFHFNSVSQARCVNRDHAVLHTLVSIIVLSPEETGFLSVTIEAWIVIILA